MHFTVGRTPSSAPTSGKSMKPLFALLLLHCALVIVCAQGKQPAFDVIVKGGTIYNGTGTAPFKADVGIKGDRIVAIGRLNAADAVAVIDAQGLAVAPGFI